MPQQLVYHKYGVVFCTGKGNLQNCTKDYPGKWKGHCYRPSLTMFVQKRYLPKRTPTSKRSSRGRIAWKTSCLQRKSTQRRLRSLKAFWEVYKEGGSHEYYQQPAWKLRQARDMAPSLICDLKHPSIDKLKATCPGRLAKMFLSPNQLIQVLS